MDSLNIFDDKPLKAPPPPPAHRRKAPRPLWQILLASGLIPGAGHLLLGKVREGVAIFLATAFSQVLATLGLAMGWAAFSWVAFRAGGALYLYAVGDSALLLYEITDGRRQLYPEPPRRVAFWNLIGYGAGYAMLGERTWAIAAGSLAALFHLGLSFLWTKAVVGGEILLLASAVHAWWLAQAQMRRRNPMPQNSTPLWLRRSLLVTAALTLLMILANQWVALAWRDALHLRRENAVSVAPFYDNPDYELHLEMASPGWAFLTPTGNELFHATHLTENAVLSLRVDPRTPWNWSDPIWMNEVLKKAQEEGWSLEVDSSAPANLGTLPGWSISARGSFKGQERTLKVVTAVRGLQHITLWYQWAPLPDTFAGDEVDQILAGLQLH